MSEKMTARTAAGRGAADEEHNDGDKHQHLKVESLKVDHLKAEGSGEVGVEQYAKSTSTSLFCSKDFSLLLLLLV